MNRSKIGYIDNIELETLENDNFRKVLYTGKNMQLVVMALQPGEEIGMEVHEGHDQFIRIEVGEVEVILNDESSTLYSDEVVIIPAGVKHNIINTTENEVQLYTIYAPPEHPADTIQEAKPE